MDRTRSGKVAANKRLIGPPSDTPSSVGQSTPAASSTACRSSMRSSRVGTRCTGSDRPVPRLSHRTRVVWLASCSMNGANGYAGVIVKVDVAHPPGHHHERNVAIAQRSIGEVNVAVARVFGPCWHPRHECDIRKLTAAADFAESSDGRAPAGSRSRDAPSPSVHGVGGRPQPPAGDQWLAGAEVAGEPWMRSARDQYPDA